MKVTLLSMLILGVLAGSVSSKIYGVNIGGWLVLEQWIVPSLFQKAGNGNIKDEWTWGQYNGNKGVLQNHWSTWFTEADAKALSAAGITHLRIPIGYWIVCTEAELKQYNEPYVTGAWPWLVNGIALAKKYNMKVLVDLHGAPGSQNGFDNSGRAGAVQWGTGQTVSRTITYLERIAQNILNLEKNATTSGTVWGLELVNEPTPWSISGGMDTIRSFYTQAYPAVRKILPAAYAVILQQGFQTDWQNFFSGSQYQNVYLDMHTYHAFAPFPTTTTQTEQITITCTTDKQNSVTSQTLPTFTGEWSAATNANYPSNSINAFRARWSLAQMNAYESGDKGQGWFFWNFKTETAEDWNYILGVQQGWLPKKLPANETSAGACQWWCNYDCCLANTKASTADVQSSFDWACANGINCAPVKSGGVYYTPNDLNHHASFAFNEWWAGHRSEGSASGCSFQGAATYCANNCDGKV